MSSYETALAADPEVANLLGQELEPPVDHPAADRLGELHLAGGAGRPGLGAHQQVLRGLSRAGATTAGTRSSTRSRTWRATAPRRCSAPSTPTSSPTPGANANLAAYQALLEPGRHRSWPCASTTAGTSPTGRRPRITSKVWRFVAYGVTPGIATTRRARARSSTSTRWPTWPRRERPQLIVAGSTAYARIIDPGRSARSPTRSGALFMFDVAHPAGLIAGGPTRAPVGVADVVTFTTHKTLRGPRGGAILCGTELAKAIDSAVFPGLQGGPLEHVIAAKAVAFAEAARP